MLNECLQETSPFRSGQFRGLSFITLFGLVEWAPKRYRPLTQQYTLGTRIGIDVLGGRSDLGPVVMMAELLPFTDTITHFNRAFMLSREPEPDGSYPPIDDRKRLQDQESSVRAALTSAYFTLEGYLHALALDHLMKTPFEDIEPKHLVRLMEWDDEKDRFKPQSLRDKLIYYPKIIIGSKHPPPGLDESNRWMRLVLDAKEIRDAVVHPSRHPDPETHELHKEGLVRNLGVERMAEVVDAVVELIFTVEAVVHGSEDRARQWLKRRGEDGLFPPNELG
jgi:hypothetical protein